MNRNFLSLSRALSGLAILGLVATASANLTINPTYDSSITGNSNAAAIETCLNQVCAMYNQNFTDNITVNVTFSNVTFGLGSNNPNTITVSYSSFRSHLAADATTSNDALALSHLPVQTNNPVDGEANVVLSTANARAIGISTNVNSDDTINLNTALCFLNHNSPQSGKYDLYAVACHEMDECLGSVSGLSFGGTPWAADMFRYDEHGNRTYDTNTGYHAYLSLDGTTDIDEYNQYQRGGGDWGDWIVHSTPQVQDWAGSTGRTIDMGTGEFTLLDAVGYNYASTPEPASFLVVGAGLAAVLVRRRKRQIL